MMILVLWNIYELIKERTNWPKKKKKKEPKDNEHIDRVDYKARCEKEAKAMRTKKEIHVSRNNLKGNYKFWKMPSTSSMNTA